MKLDKTIHLTPLAGSHPSPQRQRDRQQRKACVLPAAARGVRVRQWCRYVIMCVSGRAARDYTTVIAVVSSVCLLRCLHIIKRYLKPPRSAQYPHFFPPCSTSFYTVAEAIQGQINKSPPSVAFIIIACPGYCCVCIHSKDNMVSQIGRAHV